MVGQLEKAIDQVERSMVPHRKTILASTFGPALRRHIDELKKGRQTYGPMWLGEA